MEGPVTQPRIDTSIHDELTVIDEQGDQLTVLQIRNLNGAICRIQSKPLRLKLNLLLHDYLRMSISSLQQKTTTASDPGEKHEDGDSPLEEVRTWASSVKETMSFPASRYGLIERVEDPQTKELKGAERMLGGLKNLQENVAKIHEVFSEASCSFESYFTAPNDDSCSSKACPTSERGLSVGTVTKNGVPRAAERCVQLSGDELMDAIRRLETRFKDQQQAVSSLFQELSITENRIAELGKELERAQDYLAKKYEHRTNVERVQTEWNNFQTNTFKDMVTCADSLFPFVDQMRDLENRSSRFATSLMWAFETLQKIAREKGVSEKAQTGKIALFENKTETNFKNSYTIAGVSDIGEKVIDSTCSTLRLLREQSEQLCEKEKQELDGIVGKSSSVGDESKALRDGKIRRDFLKLKRKARRHHPNALMTVASVVNRMITDFDRLLSVFRQRELQVNVVLDNVNSTSILVARASSQCCSSKTIATPREKKRLLTLRNRRLCYQYGLLSKYINECQIRSKSKEENEVTEEKIDEVLDQSENKTSSSISGIGTQKTESFRVTLPNISSCDFARWGDAGYNCVRAKKKATCHQKDVDREASFVEIMSSDNGWLHRQDTP